MKNEVVTKAQVVTDINDDYQSHVITSSLIADENNLKQIPYVITENVIAE